MEESFNKFMSAIDIESFNVIRDSEIGNTLPYYDILQIFIIANHKDITVSELASILNLSRAATTQKVNELVEKGLVLKTSSLIDKRKVHLSISDKVTNGCNYSKAANLMAEVDKNFTDDKKLVFTEILKFMTKYLLEEN